MFEFMGETYDDDFDEEVDSEQLSTRIGEVLNEIMQQRKSGEMVDAIFRVNDVKV